MNVKVKRGDVLYFVTSEEQLKLFLEAGYEVVDKPKRKTEVATKRKTAGATKTADTKK